MLVALGGVALVLFNIPEDFGQHKLSTTVTVEKGKGANRHIRRVESTNGTQAAQSRANVESSRHRTTETDEERPGAEIARRKTRTEEEPAAFLENLIGNDGLLVVQLLGVGFVAFLISAIAYRVIDGNFQFKLGGLDFSITKAVAETASYGAELRNSVKRIEDRVIELEGAIPGLDAVGVGAGEFDARVPSNATLVSGLPPVIATEVEERAAASHGPAAPADDPAPLGSTAPVSESAKCREGVERVAEDEPKASEIARMRRARLRAEPLERLRRVVILRSPREGDEFDVLLQATFRRSARTYSAICDLIRAEQTVQAGMLVEPLYEDTIVAHWLVLNRQSPDWLVRRFHEDAAGASALRDEFGDETDFKIPFAETGSFIDWNPPSERPTMWWDPGENGEGRGAGIGLAGIVARLEEESGPEGPLLPPFATDKGAFSGQLEKVVDEWLTQLTHAAAAGLPFIPSDEGRPNYAASSTSLVAFSAAWLFALGLYLDARVNQANPFRLDDLNDAWLPTLRQLGTAALNLEAATILRGQWTERYGR